MTDNPEQDWPPFLYGLKATKPFGHPVTEFRVLETHISWVLLTGSFAYKFKKPVDLGFVDFSKLEKRKHFCEEELRLNRRFTEGLYLGLVTLTGSPESPEWNGTGKPFEYGVKMTQFPQEHLLSHLVERDGLTREHIDNLADEVARFHQQIEVAPADSSFGIPRKIMEPIEENFSQIGSSFQDDSTIRFWLEMVHRWSREEHSRLEETFIERKKRGFIRECHGDMHLGNMLLWKNKVALFDCIEFNEQFRWIDVMSEITFCVMDLFKRDEEALARRFLNRYLERTGDYAGMAVFSYYFVYRAMVRAKVDAIRLRQTGLTESEQKEVRNECLGYVDLAQRFSERLEPTLYITHGFSGSGKTYGTEPMVDEVGAIRVRSDVERKRLFGLAPEERPNSSTTRELYSEDSTNRTYERLAEVTESLLTDGFMVVVDATFLERTRRDQFRALADRLQVPFHIFDFKVPVEVLRERVRKRFQQQSDASDANLDVLEHQLRTAKPLAPDERDVTLTVTGDDMNVVEIRKTAKH